MANGNEISITCFGIFHFLGINPEEVIIPAADEHYVKGCSHVYYTPVVKYTYILPLYSLPRSGDGAFTFSLTLFSQYEKTWHWEGGAYKYCHLWHKQDPEAPCRRPPGKRLTDSALGRGTCGLGLLSLALASAAAPGRQGTLCHRGPNG